MRTGRPRPRSDLYEARSTRSLDPGKIYDSYDSGSRQSTLPLQSRVIEEAFNTPTHQPAVNAFNTTTPTYVATAPPTWEQRLRLISLFTTHTGMGNEKAATIYTMLSTVLPLDTPSTYVATTTVPRFSGARPYPFLVDPLNSTPDPASTAAGQTEGRYPYDDTGDRTTHTGPGQFTIPSSTSLRYARDGRPLPRHVATVPLNLHL
jgi:hypothetical protein